MGGYATTADLNAKRKNPATVGALMSRGWRDHFVPQHLIRGFTNEAGRVFCFDKKTRRVPDRIYGNIPRDILHKSNYYVDQIGDLDKELYKPIEDEFGPHLLALLDNVRTAIHRHRLRESLTQWVAAQASRTQFAEQLVRVYGEQFGRKDILDDLHSGRMYLRDMRIGLFEAALDAMRNAQWRFYYPPSHDPRRFVLSDEAVIESPPDWATGHMFLVPLSPTMMVAAGEEKGHAALKDPERNILPLGLNGVAMSYAFRFVYSPSLVELDSLASMFDASPDPTHTSWMGHATHPHFGLSKMIDDASEDELRRHFKSADVDALLRRRRATPG